MSVGSGQERSRRPAQNEGLPAVKDKDGKGEKEEKNGSGGRGGGGREGCFVICSLQARAACGRQMRHPALCCYATPLSDTSRPTPACRCAGTVLSHHHRKMIALSSTLPGASASHLLQQHSKPARPPKYCQRASQTPSAYRNELAIIARRRHQLCRPGVRVAQSAFCHSYANL